MGWGSRLRGRVRFDRNEWAGSFGDIGTDLPLLLAMIPAAGLDGASVFVMFGLMQILTGFLYGLPMPLQPLKAMAVLVITQGLSGDLLFGGGLAVGFVMLLLAATGALEFLARTIPKAVVRGIQLGLGLKLAQMAMLRYVPAEGAPGYVLAGACFLVLVFLLGNRRFPPALFVILLGVLYAALLRIDWTAVGSGLGFHLPSPRIPALSDVWTGFLLLALPQLPLSLSNSVIATDRTLRDLFPERRVGIRKIGLTYGFLNLVNPFFGGVPQCHGCGGLAGHYAFGGRTGGSVVIYGTLFLLLGLCFGGLVTQVVLFFPHPMLGVILLFEALTLMVFVRDTASRPFEFKLALLVGVLALTLPQGFLVAMLAGTALHALAGRFPLLGEARNGDSKGPATPEASGPCADPSGSSSLRRPPPGIES